MYVCTYIHLFIVGGRSGQVAGEMGTEQLNVVTLLYKSRGPVKTTWASGSNSMPDIGSHEIISVTVIEEPI